ncbi:tRNA-specific adenosine deaminase, partial [Candidatus Woesearchaeota archaeon]|nr:tRNA-specific adenosine deaminase [Candidatus Woesearchaeota archaeon]
MGIDSSLDEKWMKIALEQARFAQAKNEVPVGAILVKNDQLIASAH